jgi:hypothetical protein
MQADFCMRCLNELQAIFKLPLSPQIHTCEREKDQHTLKHLEAWFEPWLGFFELMPKMIHPESAKALAAEGTGDASTGGGGEVGDKGAADEVESGGTEGDSAAPAPLPADVRAEGGEGEAEDRRVRLTRGEAVRVRAPACHLLPVHAHRRTGNVARLALCCRRD